jgi:hypothetical protein
MRSRWRLKLRTEVANGKLASRFQSASLIPERVDDGWASAVSIDPLLLFSIQFSFALVAYALAARWYVWPRINQLPPAVALVPLVWVHVFRFIGGSILAPGSVGPGVPAEFREMVGYGDIVTAALALVALIALRARGPANAVVQSIRYSVFDDPLGVDW